MKKIISTLMISFIMISLTYADETTAQNNINIENTENTKSSDYIYSKTAELTRVNSGRVHLNAYMYCKSTVHKCRITVTLQEYSGGSYSTYLTAAQTSYDTDNTLDRDYIVESGVQYRAKVKFEAFDSNDNVVESSTMYTSTV